MKLFESTKNKIAKEKNGKNIRNLEITDVVLVHYNVASNDYEQDSRVLYSRQKIIDNRDTNIIMEYKKIINLLDNTPNQPTNFREKNWV